MPNMPQDTEPEKDQLWCGATNLCVRLVTRPIVLDRKSRTDYWTSRVYIVLDL